MQRVIPIESPSFISEEKLQQAGNPALLFAEPRPLAMEIGCGTGDFIIQMARQRPDLNFLAIDIYNKGCLKTCRKIDEHRLANVRVLRMEARYLLTRFLEPETLQALYINCPDPWPKKRHQQRRLVNRDFLDLVGHFLAPQGEFVFCTDFADYARQVAELFPLPGFDNCLGEASASHLEGYPFSKYMRKFRESGLPLHFIHHRKSTHFHGNRIAGSAYPMNVDLRTTGHGGAP
ncbi:MAG: tRNA (guanosine(46)-N7)-methyltransferase TrmB [Desulfuromonadaceae bacterium]|nr:tRNA (guanosine(46)-N7)-methyltransferase TrmB [Desulfuromonadaceae bacterium]